MSTLTIYNAGTNPVQATPLEPSSPNGGGLSFSDILDAVNPLQHIPVVSSVYRAVSGSAISAGAQIAGDTMYGALIGGPILAGAAAAFAASTTDVAVAKTTGQGIAGHVLATLGLGSTTPTAGTAPTLTPDSSSVSAAIASAQATQDSGAQTQAQIAAQLIAHHGLNPGHANAQYQNVQAHDAINKYLVKAVI